MFPVKHLKALNLLINAGYIQKKQGKGSIVLNFKSLIFLFQGDQLQGVTTNATY